MINEETLKRIKHLLPIRIVLQIENDRLVAKTEESFCMASSDNRAKIFWSGKAYSMLGEHQLDGIADAKHNAKATNEFVVDPLDENCPVEIAWDDWMDHVTSSTSGKYFKRNALFSVNEVNSLKFLNRALKDKLSKLEENSNKLEQKCLELTKKINEINELLNPRLEAIHADDFVDDEFREINEV